MIRNGVDWDALAAPFPEDGVEWRLQSAGEKDGRIWALCLCYLTARAIMDRLDEVVGPENWWNEYRPSPSGGVLCGITVRLEDGREITKWDGAGTTDVEPEKGALSGAFKRAAVCFGPGRYLYDLGETFANVHEKGKERGKTKDGKSFRWDPPRLPEWALPRSKEEPVRRQTASTREEKLADRIRDVAIEVDTERERTGTDLTARPALALAEEWLAAEKRNAAEMTKYGNTLGAERDRLKSFPDASAAPTYDNFQAPALDSGDDELPF